MARTGATASTAGIAVSDRGATVLSVAEVATDFAIILDGPSLSLCRRNRWSATAGGSSCAIQRYRGKPFMQRADSRSNKRAK
ncbi:MAG TPA: hypothetical protein VFY56_14255 [Propionibacteriaceae bacterium]|nr:hypothetical protein [Propionibacteriaceae bacterium]